MSHGKLGFNQHGVGTGNFRSLAMSLFMKLEPRDGDEQGGPNDAKPCHNVYIARAEAGPYVQAGAAWAKQGDGPVFYSLTIDDPSMPAPLNITAFPEKDERGSTVPGAFEIVWRRPRQHQQAA